MFFFYIWFGVHSIELTVMSLCCRTSNLSKYYEWRICIWCLLIFLRNYATNKQNTTETSHTFDVFINFQRFLFFIFYIFGLPYLFGPFIMSSLKSIDQIYWFYEFTNMCIAHVCSHLSDFNRFKSMIRWIIQNASIFFFCLNLFPL